MTDPNFFSTPQGFMALVQLLTRLQQQRGAQMGPGVAPSGSASMPSSPLPANPGGGVLGAMINMRREAGLPTDDSLIAAAQNPNRMGGERMAPIGTLSMGGAGRGLVQHFQNQGIDVDPQLLRAASMPEAPGPRMAPPGASVPPSGHSQWAGGGAGRGQILDLFGRLVDSRMKEPA